MPSGSAPLGPIAAEDQIGRLGVMYMRGLLAQAALGHSETQSGEDYLSVDLSVDFPIAPVRVQVKCGHKTPNRGGTFSVSTKPKWRHDWAVAQIPVYLVYVHLEKQPPEEWLEHPPSSTTVHVHAHWLRVNGVSATTVKVPEGNRLTLNTFAEWQRDVEECFGLVMKS
jgi:hypothetical protein